MSYYKLLFIFLIINATFAQENFPKKTTTAVRIHGSIELDGVLDEKEWLNVPVAKDFINFSPDSGKPEDPNKRTEVKIIYDDNAIYVGATMYDDKPEDIMKEIKLRDEYGSSDHFGVFFNGFNDGQQEFRFYISAAGVQIDALATSEGDDLSWDAIWDCKVKVTDFGWVAEYKIPYAALRFGKEKVQTWGVNMYREIRKPRYSYCWNHIDFTLNNEVVQGGILEGIQDIKPPVRLFFIPYISNYFNSNDSNIENTFKAGMDIKYGINDAYTLDAILVPDFGQTTFDNLILNLGPFEQQLAENRPFFTEGVDMFNKGGLFYSRRIGGGATLIPELGENESIQSYPESTNLINALKISGRNTKGLGIGILNAMTEKANAVVIDETTNQTREVLAEPFTNYNIFVVDKRFRKNSSFSFINTSLIREGKARDANVSAAILDYNTKSNNFKYYGDFKFSHVNDVTNFHNGFSTSVFFGDIKGKYQYGLSGKYVSKDYDINDMGINFLTNFYAIELNKSYRILNPTKTFNTFVLNSNLVTEVENTTGKLQNATWSMSFTSTSLKNDFFGGGIDYMPLETFDFYNPRVSGKYNFVPENIFLWTYISTNYNRKYAIDISPSIGFFNQDKRETYRLTVRHLYRANDKLFLQFQTFLRKQQNDYGWVAFDGNDIIYARRDVKTLENSISGKFSFNNVMNLNLRVRHYWSYAENSEYLTLLDNGYFTSNPEYSLNKNQNFNLWNFDLTYSWWFAPGSIISIMARNSSEIAEREFSTKFRDNFNNLFDKPNFSISFSIRYFIDYNQLRNLF